MDDPNYNPKTLHVPETFLKEQTPGQRQWWLLKAQYFDVVLFFKMGKFYELFHMDADIGVAELNIMYMKGEVAHAGFPEVAYGRYAATLVEKGYKVARIEQTETPLDMENRCKLINRPSKFDRVVKREVCQLSTKGTRVNNYLDNETFEGEPRHLLAICEGPDLAFGVAFLDTTIGIFYIGRFEDDKNLSRMRTMIAHYPPAEVLFEKNGLSPAVYKFLNASLSSGVRKEALKAGTEFWEAEKTLHVLVENSYFASESEDYWPQGLQNFIDDPYSKMANPKPNGVLAVRALGAVVWYLMQGFLDQELLSLKKFEEYQPYDHRPKIPGFQGNDQVGPKGKHMVLDGITIRNLELVPDQSGNREGTLLDRLDFCLTPMGKRTLRNWIVAPLLQPLHIKQRQSAIRELLEMDSNEHIRTMLKKVPDLERLISKIHASGDIKRNKYHPDARAVMFEGHVYSKRKIMDLITCRWTEENHGDNGNVAGEEF